MAAITDKITKTMSNQNPATTTVAAQRATGGTELRAVSLDGWQNETATHFTTYKVDAQGEVVEGSQTDWKGVVNRESNSIANIQRTGGAADQGNATGDVIQAMPTAAWGNDLAEALLVHHTPDGSLKPKTITHEHIDEKTEYRYVASPRDLNDAQFLVPGKWRFESNQQVASTRNLPKRGESGFLEVLSSSAGATTPGSTPGSYVVQVYTTLGGARYIRTVQSTTTAAATYGAWMQYAGRPATHTKDSRGWIKRELAGGVVEYAKNGSMENLPTGVNDAATDRYIELPVDVPRFDADKMTSSANVRATNAWVTASLSIYNTQTRYELSRRNNYTGSVLTCNFDYNIILRVYPE